MQVAKKKCFGAAGLSKWLPFNCSFSDIFETTWAHLIDLNSELLGCGVCFLSQIGIKALLQHLSISPNEP